MIVYMSRIAAVVAAAAFIFGMSAPAEVLNIWTDVDAKSSVELPANEDQPEAYEEEAAEGVPKKVIKEDIVRIGQNVDIEKDEVVKGDVVCIGANLTVKGTITGDAVCIGGNLTLDSTAVVRGDVATVGGELERHEDAVIGGQSVSVGVGPLGLAIPSLVTPKIIHSKPARLSPFFVLLGLFFVAMVIAVLLSAFLPGPTSRLEATAKKNFWKSFLVGFLGEVLIIPFFVLLVVSIIGLALIPLACTALVAAFLFGLTGFSLLLGNIFLGRFRAEKAHIVGATAMGILLVYVLWLVGGIIAFGAPPLGVLVIILGSLAIWVAWTAGFGAVVLTRFGSRLPAEVRPKSSPEAG